MTDREYRIRRNNAHKAHREVIMTLEKFAKRSKHITFIRKNSFWGLCRIDLSVSKNGKVAQEMLDYLKSICPYYELADLSAQDPTAWFHNCDTTIIKQDSEDEWDVEFEICVSYR